MIQLVPWERSFAVEAVADPSTRAYFWFYEWHLFDAVLPGEHTGGRHDFPWTVTDARAQADAWGIRFEARTVEDGAELELSVTNESDHDWPEAAGIIPCLSPGHAGVVEQSACFVDDDRTLTYYLGPDGLELLEAREMHFNERLRPWLDAYSPTGEFVFSDKWPTSDRNAVQGLIVREALGGGWVTGIAWEDFVGAQGHNPWNCMHLSVCVGPLARGETKTVRGRIYLFEGTREDVLERALTAFW